MSNGASYDKALLDDAPEVTPQQRQRFYDTDLLYNYANREQGTTNGSPAGAHPAASRSNTDIEAGRVTQTKEYSQLPPAASFNLPWYKTRKGIIAIIIIALVIVGAVVGGAVGGTHSSKKSSNNDDTTISQSQSSESLLSASLPVTTQGQASGTTTSTANGAPVGTSSGDTPGEGSQTTTANQSQAT